MNHQTYFSVFVEENHTLDIRQVPWPARQRAPDVLFHPNGTMLVKVGLYASEGAKFRYRVPSVLVVGESHG